MLGPGGRRGSPISGTATRRACSRCWAPAPCAAFCGSSGTTGPRRAGSTRSPISAASRSSRCRCSAISAFHRSCSSATRCTTGFAGSWPPGARRPRCYNPRASIRDLREDTRMKAIRVSTPGGPEVLRLEDVAEPAPKAGEAIVKVDAAGINYIDVYQRSGQYKLALPLTLGLEAGGTVTAVASDVTEVRVGDKVAYTGIPGAYAQFAAVPAQRLVKLPPGVSTKQGGAAMLQGLTAHYLACSTYPLKSGDTCLVHAAAGGVGLLLCQIAKMRGARVIGTVSTEDKAKLAREAGADQVILYTKQDFEVEVKHITGGKGLQVVYDSVGKTTFEKGLNCLTPRGMMVLYGQASGPIGPQTLNAKGSLFLTRPSLNHHIGTRAELLQRSNELLGWIGDGKLKLRTEFEFPQLELAVPDPA